MSVKTLTQHGGCSFVCDSCALSRYVQAENPPEGWLTLCGFTETPGQTLHACGPECSVKLKTLHKRIK